MRLTSNIRLVFAGSPWLHRQDRSHRDGKVYYKQSCRPGKLDVKRTAYAPVTVPSAEAVHVSRIVRDGGRAV